MEISRCEVTDGTVEYNTDFKLYKNNKEFEMNKQFKCVTKENDTNPEKTLKRHHQKRILPAQGDNSTVNMGERRINHSSRMEKSLTTYRS